MIVVTHNTSNLTQFLEYYYICTTMKTTPLSLALIGTAVLVEGFSPSHNNQRANTALSLGNPVESFFSFLKDGKKKMVKSQAGDYDAAAVQTRIKTLVKDTPVLMFSFTT